jgi:AAA domain
MRIAVSGTHGVGKSTLVAALGARLPGHAIVAEPYETLVERGYEFADPPGVDDFVVQLKQSLVSLRRRSPNVIFDRCPFDFLGYIAASPGAERFNPEPWRAIVSQAMATLDLVVAVHADPAHDPPIAVEDAAFRLSVDDALWDIVDGDRFDLCDGVAILPLDGPWDRRLETILAHLQRLRRQTPA